MTPNPPTQRDEFSIGFNTLPMAAEVVRTRRKLRRAAIGLMVSCPVVLVFWILAFRFIDYLWIWCPAVLIAVFSWWATVAIRLVSGKKALASIGAGVAFRIDKTGIVVSPDKRVDARPDQRVERVFTWDQIRAINSETVWLTGAQFVVYYAGNVRWSIPFSYLDVKPRLVNQAVQICSAGRFKIVSDRPYDGKLN